jgi:hypothetical protein
MSLRFSLQTGGGVNSRTAVYEGVLSPGLCVLFAVRNCPANKRQGHAPARAHVSLTHPPARSIPLPPFGSQP